MSPRVMLWHRKAQGTPPPLRGANSEGHPYVGWLRSEIGELLAFFQGVTAKVPAHDAPQGETWQFSGLFF